MGSIPKSPFYCYRIDGKKRGSSEPYISGDSFCSLADHIFDDDYTFIDPTKVKKGQIIFVATGFLSKFLFEIHPYITEPYCLITHNSDMGIPNRFFLYLLDERILVWFARNAEIAHEKIVPIPIGLKNRHFSIGDIEILKNVQEEDISKKYLLYFNFYNEYCEEERAPLKRYFSSKEYAQEGTPQNYEGYLKEVKASKFILSPRGRGLDSFRTWESMYLGVIPIVITSYLDHFFEDLPVLIIQDWNEITEDFLEKKYDEMSKKTYDLQKLTFSYWKEKIHNRIASILQDA